MKKKTIVFRFFLFFVFFILLFLVVSEVLKDKRIVQEYDASAKVKGFYEEKERDGEVGKEGEFQRAVKARPLIALILLRDQKLRGENECGKYQQKIIDEHYSFSFCLFFFSHISRTFSYTESGISGLPFE